MAKVRAPLTRLPINELKKTKDMMWLSLEETAKVLSVSVASVRRYAQRKPDHRDFLASYKLGRELKIARAGVVDFINRHAKGIEFYDPGYDPLADPKVSDDDKQM